MSQKIRDESREKREVLQLGEDRFYERGEESATQEVRRESPTGIRLTVDNPHKEQPQHAQGGDFDSAISRRFRRNFGIELREEEFEELSVVTEGGVASHKSARINFREGFMGREIVHQGKDLTRFDLKTSPGAMEDDLVGVGQCVRFRYYLDFSCDG